MIRSTLVSSSALALVTSLFLLPVSAEAQTADEVNSVLQCRTITDAQARLACFDAASSQLASAVDEGMISLNRGEVEAVERDAFGLDIPSIPNLSAAIFGDRTNDLDPSGETSSRPTTTARNDDDDRGGFLSRFTNRQSDSNTVATEPEPIVDGVQVLERNRTGEIEQIEMVIAEVEEFGYQRYRFIMQNGQIWVTSDPERIRLSRNSQNTAVIRRGAMGSYLMRINGSGAAYGVERRR